MTRTLQAAGFMAMAFGLACSGDSPTQPSGPSGPGHPSGTRLEALVLAGRPYGLDVSADGTFYVSQVDDDAVARGRLDQASQSILGTAAVGRTPTQVAINPHRGEAWVTNRYGKNLSVVDTRTDVTIDTVPLSDDGGFNLIVAPSGTRVYATTASGPLHVIDAETRAVLTTLYVGASANGLAIHESSGRLYVSSRNDFTVTAIDLLTNTVVRGYPVAGFPQRIAVSADGSTLYIASEEVGLEILDLASGATTRVSAVAEGAFGLALTPDGAELYVTIPPRGLVQVVSLASKAVTKSWMFPGPRDVTFSADGRIAVVTDEGGMVWFIR